MRPGRVKQVSAPPAPNSVQTDFQLQVRWPRPRGHSPGPLRAHRAGRGGQEGIQETARPLRSTPGTVRPKPGGCPELASSVHWHKFAHPDTVPSCLVSPRSLSSWSQLWGTHQLPGAVAQRPDTAVATAARWGPHIPGGPWLRGTRRWPLAQSSGRGGPNLAPCARAAGAAPPSVPRAQWPGQSPPSLLSPLLLFQLRTRLSPPRVLGLVAPSFPAESSSSRLREIRALDLGGQGSYFGRAQSFLQLPWVEDSFLWDRLCPSWFLFSLPSK